MNLFSGKNLINVRGNINADDVIDFVNILCAEDKGLSILGIDVFPRTLMRFSRVQKVNFIPTITLHAVKRTAQYVFGRSNQLFSKRCYFSVNCC